MSATGAPDGTLYSLFVDEDIVYVVVLNEQLKVEFAPVAAIAVSAEQVAHLNYKADQTDILIRVEDKNIFIAECKFWAGAKLLCDTIDQLLGYLSWRHKNGACDIQSE